MADIPLHQDRLNKLQGAIQAIDGFSPEVKAIPEIKAHMDKVKGQLNDLKYKVKEENYDTIKMGVTADLTKLYEDAKKAKIDLENKKIIDKVTLVKKAIDGLSPDVQKVPKMQSKIVAIGKIIDEIKANPALFETRKGELNTISSEINKLDSLILERLKKLKVLEEYVDGLSPGIVQDPGIESLVQEIKKTIDTQRNNIGADDYDTKELTRIRNKLATLLQQVKFLDSIKKANPQDLRDLEGMSDDDRKTLLVYSTTFADGEKGEANMVSCLRNAIKLDKSNGKKPRDKQKFFEAPGSTKIDKPDIKEQAKDVAEYANEYGTTRNILLSLANEHKKILEGKDDHPTTFKWVGMDSDDTFMGIGNGKLWDAVGVDDTYNFSSPEDKKEFLEDMMKLIPVMDQIQNETDRLSQLNPNDKSFGVLVMKVLRYSTYATNLIPRIATKAGYIIPGMSARPFSFLDDGKMLDFKWHIATLPLPQFVGGDWHIEPHFDGFNVDGPKSKYLASLDLQDSLWMLYALYKTIRFLPKAFQSKTYVNLYKSITDMQKWKQRLSVLEGFSSRLNGDSLNLVETSQAEMIKKMKVFIQERAQPGYVPKKRLGILCDALSQEEANRLCDYIDGEVARALVYADYDSKRIGQQNATDPKPLSDKVRAKIIRATLSPNKGFINFMCGLSANRAKQTLRGRFIGDTFTDFVRGIKLGPIRGVPLVISDWMGYYTPQDALGEKLSLVWGKTDVAWNQLAIQMGIDISPKNDRIIDKNNIGEELKWLKESGIVNTPEEQRLYDETLAYLTSKPHLLGSELDRTLLSLSYVCRGDVTTPIDAGDLTSFRSHFLGGTNNLQPLTNAEILEVNSLVAKFKGRTADSFDLFRVRALLYQPDATQLLDTNLRPRAQSILDTYLTELKNGGLTPETFTTKYKEWLNLYAKDIPWGYDPKKALDRHLEEHGFESQKKDIKKKIEEGSIPDKLALEKACNKIAKSNLGQDGHPLPDAVISDVTINAFINSIPEGDFIVYKMQNGTPKGRYEAYKKYQALETSHSEEYKRNKAIADVCLESIRTEFNREIGEFKSFVENDHNTVEQCSEKLRVTMQNYGATYLKEQGFSGTFDNFNVAENVLIPGCDCYVQCIRDAEIANTSTKPSTQYEAIERFEANMPDVTKMGGSFVSGVSEIFGGSNARGLRRIKIKITEEAKAEIMTLKDTYGSKDVSETEFNGKKQDIIARIGEKMYKVGGGEAVEVNYRRARYLKLTTDWITEIDKNGRESTLSKQLEAILDSGEYETNKQGDPSPLSDRAREAHERFLKRNPNGVPAPTQTTIPAENTPPKDQTTDTPPPPETANTATDFATLEVDITHDPLQRGIQKRFKEALADCERTHNSDQKASLLQTYREALQNVAQDTAQTVDVRENARRILERVVLSELPLADRPALTTFTDKIAQEIQLWENTVSERQKAADTLLGQIEAAVKDKGTPEEKFEAIIGDESTLTPLQKRLFRESLGGAEPTMEGISAGVHELLLQTQAIGVPNNKADLHRGLTERGRMTAINVELAKIKLDPIRERITEEERRAGKEEPIRETTRAPRRSTRIPGAK